jgi:hypothetical protein
MTSAFSDDWCNERWRVPLVTASGVGDLRGGGLSRADRNGMGPCTICRLGVVGCGGAFAWVSACAWVCVCAHARARVRACAGRAWRLRLPLARVIMLPPFFWNRSTYLRARIERGSSGVRRVRVWVGALRACARWARARGGAAHALPRALPRVRPRIPDSARVSITLGIKYIWYQIHFGLSRYQIHFGLPHPPRQSPRGIPRGDHERRQPRAA